MADPELKPQVKSNPSKSYSVFLCKSLFIALVLVCLPLFPSQAPEFINQTVLTKLWELLHLLFIGIAVSYGLFGRRNAEINSENQPKLDNSQTYMSGILHISSIFDNGRESTYGSDEKRMMQNRNSLYLENGHENPYGFEEKKMIHSPESQLLESEWRKPRSLDLQNNLESDFLDEKKVRKTGFCEYLHGESVVFVSQESSVLDERGEKPKWEIDYKPLGLPVRSLRSRIVDHDIPEYINGNGSSSDSKDSCKKFGEIMMEKFRGLTPTNLDSKFKETVSLSSTSGGSRSYRSELREDKSNSTVSLSVGESESDHIKSQSFWSSIFSQTSPESSPTSPEEKIPDLEKEEIPDLEKEGLEGNGEESSVTTKTRGFSVGSMAELKVQRNREEKLKGFSRSMREDPLGRGNWRVESWETEGKPKSPVRPFLRGKSVRTIRASENVFEGPKMRDVHSDHVEDKVGKKINYDRFESRQNVDDFPLKQRSKMSKHQNGERQDFVKAIDVDSEMGSDSESEKFQVSSDDNEEDEREEEEAQSEIANGEELDPNEVDKKASEFIAKFREQIRLQKIASIKGSIGGMYQL